MRTFRHSAYSQIFRENKSGDGTDKLFVRSIGYTRADSNFHEKPRLIKFGCLYWCIEGRASFTLNKRRYTLSPGEVWYYPPGSIIDYRPLQEGMLYYWMALYGAALEPLFYALDINAGKRFCGPPPDETFQQLISEVRNSPPNRRIDVLKIGMDILFKIASPPQDNTPRMEQTLAQEARGIIEKEFDSHAFSIAKLADMLNVHSVTLCRDFKKEFQLTPSEFLNVCRMQKAMELLESRRYLVKEVADMCGFSSPEYFATAFAARFGSSPSRILSGSPKKLLPETPEN
ncbi:MAG: helix-turn-helix transcriptional regulator [Lentisphaeria bacterium]|nr:helix-turn-helix transcriptional regulator [Lentisphaeria bacterium]